MTLRPVPVRTCWPPHETVAKGSPNASSPTTRISRAIPRYGIACIEITGFRSTATPPDRLMSNSLVRHPSQEQSQSGLKPKGPMVGLRNAADRLASLYMRGRVVSSEGSEPTHMKDDH